MKAELEGTEATDRATEAEQTVRDAIAAGVRVESLELEWGRLGGLDALVEGFVMRRDVPSADPVPEELDLAEFRGYAEELLTLVTRMKGASRGAEWLRRTARLVEGLSGSHDPNAIYREVLSGRVKPPDYKKGTDFEGEKDAWAVWKTFTEGKDRGDVALWDDLVAPLHRWMAKRLVRLFPVVTALYRKVKARHHAVDQVDLLLELRDLLARDKAVRCECQAPLGDIFVDEFQDTDPRFERPPGDTARDLLEKTAFARAAALGPNGIQRLQDLREIFLALDHLAAREGLDYDSATALLREWVSHPIQLDPPFPIDGDAVQVMTVHQAKGLEFPVVVMWDGVAPLVTRPDHSEWRVAPESRAWVLVLHRLSWEEPPDLKLKETEKKYLDAERKRLVYVEATRARDLLVLPKAGKPDTNKIQGWLLGESVAGNVRELEPYLQGQGAPWSRGIESPEDADLTRVTVADQEIRARWLAAAREAARPRFQPVGVASHARLADEDKEEEIALPVKKREGRYGALFGETVHRAIGIAMRDPACTAADAVGRAVEETALAQRLDEAAADVGRALEALRAEGLLRQPGPSLRLEYPIAGAGENGTLLVGFIDLVSATEGQLDVIDFKTDSPPEGEPRQTYPEDVEQVRIYGRLLEAAGLAKARRIRCGLLFTAEGLVR